MPLSNFLIFAIEIIVLIIDLSIQRNNPVRHYQILPLSVFVAEGIRIAEIVGDTNLNDYTIGMALKDIP